MDVRGGCGFGAGAHVDSGFGAEIDGIAGAGAGIVTTGGRGGAGTGGFGVLSAGADAVLAAVFSVKGCAFVAGVGFAVARRPGGCGFGRVGAVFACFCCDCSGCGSAFAGAAVLVLVFWVLARIPGGGPGLGGVFIAGLRCVVLSEWHLGRRAGCVWFLLGCLHRIFRVWPVPG